MRSIRKWLPVMALLFCLQALIVPPARAQVAYSQNFDSGLGSFANRSPANWATSTASSGSSLVPQSLNNSVRSNTGLNLGMLAYTGTLTQSARSVQVLTVVQQSNVAHGNYAAGSYATAGAYLCSDGNGNEYRFSFVSTNGQSTTFESIQKWSANGATAATINQNNVSSLSFADGDAVYLKAEYDGANTLRMRIWKVGTAEPSTWQMSGSDASPYNTQTGCGIWVNATRTTTATTGVSTAGVTTNIAVSSSANFQAGAVIVVGKEGTADSEVATVSTIPDGTHITLTAPVVNGHIANETVYNAPYAYADDVYLGAPGTSFLPAAPTPTTTNNSYNSVSLQWSAATGGDGTYYYDVQRATNSAFSTGLTTLSSLQTGATYTDGTVSASTTYWYRVIARDATLNSSAGTPFASLPLVATGAGLQVTTPATPVAATAYTVTPPSPAQGQVSTASAAWTVQPNGYLQAANNLVVTVTDDLSNTVATLTFTPNGTTTPASQTFTYTPPSTGTRTLTYTHTYAGSPSISDQSAQMYLSIPAPFTIAPTTSTGGLNPAARMSPYNWVGDGGTSGSTNLRMGTGNYIQTWNPGAYVTFYWSSTNTAGSCNILFDTTSSPYPAPNPLAATIAYNLDGQYADALSVTSSTTSIATAYNGSTALPSGSHVLTVWFRASTGQSRWTEGAENTNVLRIKGIQVDGLAVAGTAPTSKGYVLMVGDSILEGFWWNGASTPQDFSSGYGWTVAQGLLSQGYDVGISACGRNGWIAQGDSGFNDVPGYYPVTGSSSGTGGTVGTRRWNRIDGAANHSLLDSNSHLSAYGSTGQEPTLIVTEIGVNEIATSQTTSDTQASVNQALPVLRAAAPAAIIVVDTPFQAAAASIYPTGAGYVTAIDTGVSAYLAANPGDTNTYNTDLGTANALELASARNGANVHPNQLGAALVGSRVLQDILNKLTPSHTIVIGNGGSGQVKRGR